MSSTGRQRHAMLGFHPVALADLQRRLDGITGIDFFEVISREYRVSDYVARVSVETAIQDGAIGLVRPRTTLDFQHLVAQALAEIAGASNVAQVRALATGFLPLVLCRTTGMLVYLERMGVDIRGWSDQAGTASSTSKTRPQRMSARLSSRHTAEGFRHRQPRARRGREASPRGARSPSPAPTPLALAASPPPVPPPFDLPDFGEVTMSVAPTDGSACPPRSSGRAGSGGSSNGWTPRGAAEVERDHDWRPWRRAGLPRGTRASARDGP